MHANTGRMERTGCGWVLWYLSEKKGVNETPESNKAYIWRKKSADWSVRINRVSKLLLDHRRKSTSWMSFSCSLWNKSKKCVFLSALPALHGEQRQNWNLLFFSVSLDLRMKHALHNMRHVPPNVVLWFQRPDVTFKRDRDARLF